MRRALKHRKAARRYSVSAHAGGTISWPDSGLHGRVYEVYITQLT